MTVPKSRRSPQPKNASRATHVALLRGINVGKAKRIAMADLKRVVADLAYENVRTLLNSGNIVFTATKGESAGHAARIGRAIEQELGVKSRVTVLEVAELEVIVANNPLHSIANDPSRLLVTVPQDVKDCSRLVALAKANWHPDALAVGERVAYAWCSKGVLDSAVSKAIDREFKDAVTSRNWSTILKLSALAKE